MMESIAPVWDANQTWLVFGGGAIFAAFPVVYGVLSSALYLPLMGLGSGYLLGKSLKARREKAPLLGSIGLFLSGYFGLATSMYPYAIPPTVTLYEAAAQPETMRFTLWGAVIVLPIVIACIVYSYSVFRGKVSPEGSYGSGG